MLKYLFLITAVVVATTAGPLRDDVDDDNLTDAEIFHGQEADRGEWPWTVLLKIGDSICAGTLMSKNWVLSVATCALGGSSITAVVGEYDRSEENGTRREVPVDSFKIHPDFNISTLENNVALLRLKRSVKYITNNTWRIPEISDTTIDDRIVQNRSIPCYTTGWGYHTEGGGVWTLPSVQQELKVRMMTNNRCNRLRQGLLLSTVTDEMICFRKPDASTCAGDTGNPIMCNVDGRWTLVGINCFKYDEIDGCRGGAKIAFRVSSYSEWIGTIVKRFA